MLDSYARYAELRDKYRLRDAEVARESGVPKALISEWKRGLYTPKIDKLIKIANVFGTSAEYIATGNDIVLSEENAKLAAEIRSDRDLRELVDYYREDPEFFAKILTMLRLGTPAEKNYISTTLDMINDRKNKK